MTDNNYQEVIKNNKLFDGIPPQNLKFPFNNDEIVKLKEGEIVFQKGDESKFTYLVLAGRVKIKVYIENKSVKLNKIEKDFFGEIEVLEDTYRRSAAVANTDCILYLISKSDLRSYLAEIPLINDNIIAYNKVEIPELNIIVHPDILKKDTDKIYLHTSGDNEPESGTPEKSEELGDENPMKQEEIITKTDDEEIIQEERKDTETVDFDSFTGQKSDDHVSSKDIPEMPETMEETNVIIEDKNSEAEREPEVIQPEDDKKVTGGDENNEIDTPVEEDLKNDNVEPGEILPTESDLNDEIVGNDDKWSNPEINYPVEENHYDFAEAEKEKLEEEEEKLKYNDTKHHLEKILDTIYRINSATNEKDLYSNIIHETVKLTEAQAGILYLVDNIKKQMITDIETEEGITRKSFPLGSGLAGMAAETGEIINIREPLKDFRYSNEVDGIRGLVGSSMLCVPVFDDDKETIAVICLVNSSTGKFLLEDEEKISSLTPHISQSLQKLSFFRQTDDYKKNIHLSTLTRFVTDNIKTPVLTMKYYASRIKKKNVPADIKTVLNVLMDQADSVVNFLHSTLAYTENKNSLHIEEYDLRELIDNALILLAEYVESRNVTLYKKVEGDVKLKVDKNAFYQACFQIAKNACDAMGETGNIYITAKRSGDLVNIEFRDTGPGISDEIKPQIFQPFKTFNKEYGTGLGLSVAQKIIRDHGGELTVESSPGQGAIFVVSLPFFGPIKSDVL